MIVAQAGKLKHVTTALILGSILLQSSCDELELLPPSDVQCSELLLQSDVEAILARAVGQAQCLNQSIHVAVSDREGSILGVFTITGSVGSAPIAFTKARTATYLSSNQNAFTTLTACFITRHARES